MKKIRVFVNFSVDIPLSELPEIKKNWEDDEFDTHPEIMEYLKRNDFLNEKIEYEINGWDEI